MNKSQIRAIDENLSDLIDRADVRALILYFHTHGAFKFSKYDSFNELRFRTNDERAAEFFKAIKEIEKGWDLLEKGLQEANQKFLWKQLFEGEQAARAKLEQEKKIQDMEVRS